MTDFFLNSKRKGLHRNIIKVCKIVFVVVSECKTAAQEILQHWNHEVQDKTIRTSF